MNNKQLEFLVDTALREDIPEGDITSEALISPESYSKAIIMAKQKGVLAGIDVAELVFKRIDDSVCFEKKANDGQKFNKSDILAYLEGKTVSILKGERVALNFLQRMSGVATLTSKFVERIEGAKTQILDTRKTTPGIRALEKYAVRMGGGKNHRMSLSDMVLIKDNHLTIVGSISKAIKKVRQKIKPGIKIEVETKNLDEVKQALDGGADIIMLDNMTLGEIERAVKIVKGRVPLEISGNINLNNIRQIAQLGVDYISIGRLTHSYKSIDISLEILKGD
ncbi:MAG: carboxylating nicotinate-nucleotide diphosphorylase [Candidatus Aminicenantia bacterium]